MPEWRSCGARWRVQFADPGWTCHGTGLVKLMDGPRPEGEPDGPRIPVVGPESAMDEIMLDVSADVFHPEPFTGGDHLHLVLQSRRPQVSGR